MCVNIFGETFKKLLTLIHAVCYHYGVNIIHHAKGGKIMNSPEFRAAVARSGKTNRELASSLNLSDTAFYNKVCGRNEFKNSEIKKLAELLRLSMKDVNLIFFDETVN